jgi:hypothetical protein
MEAHRKLDLRSTQEWAPFDGQLYLARAIAEVELQQATNREDSQKALNLFASTPDQVSSENVNAAWASVRCIAGG